MDPSTWLTLSIRSEHRVSGLVRDDNGLHALAVDDLQPLEADLAHLFDRGVLPHHARRRLVRQVVKNEFSQEFVFANRQIRLKEATHLEHEAFMVHERGLRIFVAVYE